MFRRSAIALSVLACAVPLSALVATKSRTTISPLDTKYVFVGQINGATAVPVGPRSVLTARHVGEGNFTLNGQTYTKVAAYRPPDMPVPGSDPTVNSRVDLLLITVDRDLPGYYPLAHRVRVRQEGVAVGYGISGRAMGDGMFYGLTMPAGERRAGVLAISRKRFRKDLGPTLEGLLTGAGRAAVASGDSGGAFFVGGRLAGSISFTFNDSALADGTNKYNDYGLPAANTAGYVNLETGETLPANAPYFGSGMIDLTHPHIKTWLAQNIWRPAAP